MQLNASPICCFCAILKRISLTVYFSSLCITVVFSLNNSLSPNQIITSLIFYIISLWPVQCMPVTIVIIYILIPAFFTFMITLLKRVKHFVSLNSIRKQYFFIFCTLIYSTVQIYLAVFTNLTFRIYLRILQKKATRIIINSLYDAYTNPFFLENKSLPLEKLIIQNRRLSMHSVS